MRGCPSGYHCAARAGSVSVFMPTSITVAPGLTNYFVTRPARPIAATRMSASRRHSGKIGRLRVADRHRRVALQQQQRHRLADDVAAADDARPASSDWDAFRVQQLDDPEGGARHHRWTSLDEPTDAARRNAVDVFVRGDGVEDSRHRAVADRRGQRSLHQNAVVSRTPIQPLDQREHVCERRVLWQPFEIGTEPCFAARLQLEPDVDLRGRILSDKDDRQSGRATVLPGEFQRLRRDLLAHPRGKRLPVERSAHSCGLSF